jgi:hypothetical protein
MRTFLLASIALGTMASGALAAAHNPLVVWQGGVTITGLTDACGTGSEVGDLWYSVFRPRLDPAEPVTGLSMISKRSAATFYKQSGADDQMHGSGTYVGDWIGGRVTSGSGTNTGNYTLTITPAVIIETTVNVDIKGSITNFENTVGCTLKFRGSYTLRPN